MPRQDDVAVLIDAEADDAHEESRLGAIQDAPLPAHRDGVEENREKSKQHEHKAYVSGVRNAEALRAPGYRHCSYSMRLGDRYLLHDRARLDVDDVHHAVDVRRREKAIALGAVRRVE